MEGMVEPTEHSHGRRDRRPRQGRGHVPLGDKAALRVVGYYTEFAGFIDALQEGGESPRT